jgi:hypothetical protein
MLANLASSGQQTGNAALFSTPLRGVGAEVLAVPCEEIVFVPL